MVVHSRASVVEPFANGCTRRAVIFKLLMHRFTLNRTLGETRPFLRPSPGPAASTYLVRNNLQAFPKEMI